MASKTKIGAKIEWNGCKPIHSKSSSNLCYFDPSLLNLHCGFSIHTWVKFHFMNILELLKKEHSKNNTLAIVNYIGSDQDRLKELLGVFALGDVRLTQRASWPLSYVAEQQPDLVQPELPFLLSLLNKPLHVAVKRNVMRILQDYDLPEELLGEVADKCFAYILDKKEAIAVRAFAIKTLYRICVKEPDLKNELIPLLEDIIPLGSPGLKGCSQKVLKALNKL